MSEQLYRFVDKSGNCFRSFQLMGEDDCDRRYHDFVGAMLRASNDNKHDFTVGDMMAFKDELIDARFKWGIDFFVKKVDK